MELNSQEKFEEVKRKRAADVQDAEADGKTERFGLWWGLSAAGVVTVGVLALALYTHYQETKKPEELVTCDAVCEQQQDTPAGEALLAAEAQAQGMTAPAEEVPAASTETASAAASSPAAVILADTQPAADDAARIQVENGVVKFYFASGRSDLADGTIDALADVVAGVRAGKKAVVSGYADHTGDAALNEQLSKERAFKVRDALLAAGIPESSIEMEKPQHTTGSGSKEEARRVEVVLR